MNLYAPVRDRFRSSSSTAMGVLKIIGAGALFLSVLFSFISVQNQYRSSLLLVSSMGTGTIMSALILLELLIPIVLVGMGILWAVSFFCAKKRSISGVMLHYASISSISFSLIGSLLCVIMAMFLSGYQKITSYSASLTGASAYSGNIKAFFTVSMILLIAGAVSLPITSIARLIFYRSVNKSFYSETPAVYCAPFYAVMKFINALIKLAIPVPFILLITDKNTDTSSLTSATPVIGADKALGIISFVLMIVALIVGIIASIVEGIMALNSKKPLYPHLYGNPVSEDGFPLTAERFSDVNPYAESGENTVAPPPPAQEPAVCPNCGAPQTEQNAFCENCGFKLS